MTILCLEKRIAAFEAMYPTMNFDIIFTSSVKIILYIHFKLIAKITILL